MSEGQIHPTAVLEGDIELGDGVSIGPHCVLQGRVRIGAGTRLLGHCYLHGRLEIGSNNLIYPFACLGFAPQSTGHDPREAGPGLVIGDENTIREGVTIHRAMTNHGPTIIGNGNYFMGSSHVGHDAVIQNNCTLSNGALIAGHVHIEDDVVAGGNVAVHQFCRVGRGAMLSGGMAMSMDLPPFFMLTGFNVAGSVNQVGMRRLSLSSDDIEDVKLAYKTLYRRGHSLRESQALLRQHADRPMIADFLRFLDDSKRGICPAHISHRRPSEASSERALG